MLPAVPPPEGVLLPGAACSRAQAVVVGLTQSSALVLALEWLGISCDVRPFSGLRGFVAELRDERRRTRRCEAAGLEGQGAMPNSAIGLVGIFLTSGTVGVCQQERVSVCFDVCV